MSLLENYKSSGLLFNDNFLEQTSEAGMFGYRGELVLIGGEVADARGHVKPPEVVMRGVAMLATDKLLMIIGAIDQLQDLQMFIEKYKTDLAGDVRAVIFVVDIDKAMQVEVYGVHFTLIPLQQGMPWNEMLDELALEKSDFKGQSAADKIVTLYSELCTYNPKYPTVDYNEALSSTTGAVRQSWGAV